MRKSEKIGFEEDFSGFSGAASGFDEPEFTRGEDVIVGVGLSVAAMQSVARRQLIGSIVVGLLIAAAAGLAALRPAYRLATAAPTHGFALAQQPMFVTLADQRLAATKRAIEVP